MKSGTLDRTSLEITRRRISQTNFKQYLFLTILLYGTEQSPLYRLTSELAALLSVSSVLQINCSWLIDMTLHEFSCLEINAFRDI